LSIAELAHTISEVLGYRGEIRLDPTKPDGTPRKLMDSSRIRSLGWAPRTPLSEGITLAYQDFLDRYPVE
ncbi:MAG: GDP-L-fucose synthase, partial [Bacteroidota bacterium]